MTSAETERDAGPSSCVVTVLSLNANTVNTPALYPAFDCIASCCEQCRDHRAMPPADRPPVATVNAGRLVAGLAASPALYFPPPLWLFPPPLLGSKLPARCAHCRKSNGLVLSAACAATALTESTWLRRELHTVKEKLIFVQDRIHAKERDMLEELSVRYAGLHRLPPPRRACTRGRARAPAARVALRVASHRGSFASLACGFLCARARRNTAAEVRYTMESARLSAANKYDLI